MAMLTLCPPGFTPARRVGVGEGVLYRWLCQQGYEVTGVVEPGTKDEVARKLQKHDLLINLVEAPLWDWDLQADACVSQSVFQDYRQHEVEMTLKAMLKAAPIVLFSVPTVHYPEAATAGQSLSEYAPENPQADAFRRLAEEVIGHG